MRTLAFWPTRDLADVLLVDLGHGVHDFGVADFDDSLVGDALAGPDVDAQDLPFDRRAHFGGLEIGTRHRQAGLGLNQLGLGDLDIGRANGLQARRARPSIDRASRGLARI